jgi:hypothetical protein
MTPNQFNEDRLVKYARYLQCNKLKCAILRPAISQSEIADEIKQNSKLRPLLIIPILEIPIIFTGQWYYNKDYLPVYKENKEQETISSVIEFFGINRYIFYHIWSPGSQRPEIYGGKKLGPKPSVKDVASNILDLVEVVKYYENVKGCDAQFNLN